MKNPDPKPATISSFPTERSGPAPSVIAPCMAMLALALCPASLAQSATNFDTKQITPEAAAQKETAAPVPAAEVVTTEAGPSRYVGETNLAAYVQSLSSVFSMRTRATDPFGQLQDPDAKPIIKQTIAKPTRRSAPARITPFAEIIARIQITTIMPGERSFLVGTRSFKQGDRFPIKFRDRDISVEVADVSARQVEFRSLESGETANLKLNLVPIGMTPGNGKITPPGMVRDRPNSPLEIETSNSSADTSQN
jgi:hypothetical protein